MSDDTNKPFNLNMHTARLLMREPFFAALSRRIHKTPTTAIPTAGVMINKTTAQFEMVYNPAFFEGLTDVEQKAVLKHEFYHLISQHVTGRLPPEGMSKMWNVATDLAINSFIADELPEGGCVPGKGPFEDYPLEQSAEWYFSKLQNDDQFKPKDGDGDGQGGEGGGQRFPCSPDHEGSLRVYDSGQHPGSHLSSDGAVG